MAFSANLGGWIADTLVSKGLSVTTVRKVAIIFLILKSKSFSSSNSIFYGNRIVLRFKKEKELVYLLQISNNLPVEVIFPLCFAVTFSKLSWFTFLYC